MKRYLAFVLVVTMITVLFSGLNIFGGSSTYADSGASGNIVVPYPAFLTDTPSTVYTVTVNGTPVYVHKHSNFSYVHFAFAGKADVAVTVNDPASADVKTYTLSPTRYSVSSVKSGNTVSFSLTEPRKLMLHKVNALQENLVIFAEPLEENAPKLGDANVVNIQDFAVDDSGKSDTSKAINSVISTRIASGGVLYFPAGSYLIENSVKLKSNMTMYLAPGAEIVQAAKDGISSNMIDIVGTSVAPLSNVTIKGRGRLNGNGLYNRYHSFGWYGMIYTDYASHLKIEDLTTFNPGGAGYLWAQHGDYIDVYNAKEISDIGIENTDGFDFDGCRHCTVDNVFIKGTDDFGNLGSDSLINDDITETNMIDYNNGMGGGFVGGSSTKKDCSNMTWENGDVIAAPQGFRALSVYGAKYSNYNFNNIHVEELIPGRAGYTYGFGFKNKVPYWDSTWPGKVGSMDGIHFNYVTIDSTPTSKNELVSWSPANQVKNVSFNHVMLGGKPLSSIDDIRNNPAWKTVDLARGGSIDTTTLSPEKKAAVLAGTDTFTLNDLMDDAAITQAASQGLVHDYNDYSTITFPNTPATFINVTATDPNASKLTSKSGTFTFTRSSAAGDPPVDTSAPLSVNYKIRGNAINGTDYEMLSGTVIIPAGQTYATVTVKPKNNGIHDIDGIEQVLAVLKTGAGYYIDKDFLATVNIADSASLAQTALVNEDFNSQDISPKSTLDENFDSQNITSPGTALDENFDSQIVAANADYTENFDSMTADAQPAGWTVTESSANTTAKVVAMGAGDNALQIVDTDKTAGQKVTLVKTLATPVAGSFTFEYKIKVPTTSDQRTSMYLQDSSGNNLCHIWMDDLGDAPNLYIAYDDTRKAYSYIKDATAGDLKVQPDTWYTIKLAGDTAAKTYDLYVNGQLMQNGCDNTPTTGIPFLSSSFTGGIAKVYIDTPGSSAAGTSYLDDISLTTPPVSAQPAGWTVTESSANTTAKVVVMGAGDNALQITDTDKTAGQKVTLVKTLAAPVAGSFTFEYKIKVPSTADQRTSMYLQDSSGNNLCHIWMDDLGDAPNLYIAYDDTRKDYSYIKDAAAGDLKVQADTWYTIKLTGDTAAKTYDLYVNGQLMQNGCDNTPTTGIPFLSSSFTGGIAKVYIDTPGSSAAGTTYLDDLKLTAAPPSTAPAGWVVNEEDAGTKACVIAMPDTGEQVLKISDASATGSLNAEKSFTETAGIVTLQFKLMAPADPGQFVSLDLRDTAFGSVSAIHIYNDKEGSVPYLAVASSGNPKVLVDNLAPGQWYNLRIVADTTTHKYDAFVDGIQKVVSADFYDGATGTTTLLDKADNLYISTGSAGHMGELYFDDIIIGTPANSSNGGNPPVVNAPDPLYYENFNSMTANVQPAGWVCKDGSNSTLDSSDKSIIIDNVPDSANKSLKIAHSSATIKVLASNALAAPLAAGKYTFSYRIMFGAQQENRLALVSLQDAAGKTAVDIFNDNPDGRNPVMRYFDKNGDGQTLGNIVMDGKTWYTVMVDFNLATKKADYYLNGALAASQVDMTDPTAGPVTQVSVRSSSSYACTAYVDDIKIAPYVLTSDATLASLNVIANGQSSRMEPVFSPSATAYTAYISKAADTVDIIPVLNDPHGSMIMNGEAISSGTHANIQLNPGDNAVQIIVTSPDGNFKNTYRLNINRILGQAGSFTVDSPTFTDFTGKSITELQAGGFIQTSVNIRNVDKAALYATLIIALYDKGGSVKNLSTACRLVNADETVNLGAGFSLPDKVGGCYIKVFVWNSLDPVTGMQQLSSAVRFPAQ